MPITISTPWGERKAAREMEGFAKLHGLRFSDQDAFGLSMLPFAVLQAGDSNECRHIVYGTWKDINMWAFVARSTHRDNDGSDSSEFHTCAAAPIPADCPAIAIHSAGAVSRAFRRAGLGAQPIPFESADFNAAFHVRASEPKFAHELIDPEMMEWLLAEGSGWHFSVSGRHALIYRNRQRHDAEQTGLLLDLMAGFYGRLPDVLVSLYPLNQPKVTPQLALDMAKARAAGFQPAGPGVASGGAPVEATRTEAEEKGPAGS